MLKKVIWAMMALLYTWGAVAGYGYFGTGTWAQKLRRTSVYMIAVARPLSAVLGVNQEEGDFAGRLLRIEQPGEIKFKPAGSFVFYPANEGQEFFGRTVVSTGAGTKIVVELGEGAYELKLDENSTVVLEGLPPESEGTDLARPLQVEIVSGKVSAKATAKADKRSSAPQLELIDIEEGSSTELSQESRSEVVKESRSEPIVENTIQVENVILEEPILEKPIAKQPPVMEKAKPAAAPSKVAVMADNTADNPNNFNPEDVGETPIPFEESKEGFSKTVEKSMEELFQTELNRGNCGNILDMRSEIMLTYLENKRLQKFLKHWAGEIKKHGCR